MKDLRNELRKLEVELDIITEVSCSESEVEQYKKLKQNNEQLPKDIHETTDTLIMSTYCKSIRSDLTDDEIQRLLFFRQTIYLRSIKNMMTFFVILAVLSLVGTLIILMR